LAPFFTVHPRTSPVLLVRWNCTVRPPKTDPGVRVVDGRVDDEAVEARVGRFSSSAEEAAAAGVGVRVGVGVVLLPCVPCVPLGKLTQLVRCVVAVVAFVVPTGRLVLGEAAALVEFRMVGSVAAVVVVVVVVSAPNPL